MSFFYLSDDDKEKCFVYYAKGTIFQDEPAYVTAYDICNGLTVHFNEVEADACRFSIPLRDAGSGRYFNVAATPGAIDKMISWLRTKHYIFYTPGVNLDAVLDSDGLSHRVEAFWDIEDRRKREAEREDQEKLEEYCKNDPACGLSLKKLHMQYVEIQRLKKERDELKERLEKLEGGGYACSGCKRTTCGYFTEILSSLGVKNAVVYPPRGQSKVECFAKLANERAHVIFKENQTLRQQVDSFSKIAAEDKDKIESLKRVISGLNIQASNQAHIIKKQDKQLKDLGVALSNVKNTVDCEIDDLMKTHGDDIIPIF